MGIKRHKPEEIVTTVQQVEVMCGQGMPRIDAIRQVQITEQAFYRWRKQYGGMGIDHLKGLKRLQNWSRSSKRSGGSFVRRNNDRLLRAVSDPTLDKRILSVAARGNYGALRVVVPVSIMFAASSRYRSGGPVVS